MFIEQPPLILRWLYPRAFWRMDKNEKAVYLTFDDGPIPEITPWVLDLLDKYNIKATFFLVGDNVRKHPKEFQMIVERGHRLGNHTFTHIREFEHRSKNYLANTDKANELIHTNLFRPPHGHMRWMQYMVLRHKYQIVMWDLVTRDYSNKLNGRQVLRKVKHYVRNGSIITFHDSIKAEKNMKYALPRAIEWLLEQGYAFKVFDWESQIPWFFRVVYAYPLVYVLFYCNCQWITYLPGIFFQIFIPIGIGFETIFAPA